MLLRELLDVARSRRKVQVEQKQDAVEIFMSKTSNEEMLLMCYIKYKKLNSCKNCRVKDIQSDRCIVHTRRIYQSNEWYQCYVWLSSSLSLSLFSSCLFFSQEETLRRWRRGQARRRNFLSWDSRQLARSDISASSRSSFGSHPPALLCISFQ